MEAISVRDSSNRTGARSREGKGLLSSILGIYLPSFAFVMFQVFRLRKTTTAYRQSTFSFPLVFSLFTATPFSST